MITCTFEDNGTANLRHVTVGCLVIKDGRILLAKRSKGLLEAGKWGLLGGYMNRDETTAETAVREVKEESGWTIEDLQMLRLNDNPNRPHEDRQNVDIIYVANAVKEVGKPDWESEELKWFPLNELPSKEQIAFDHADSIDLYKKHLMTPLPLPIVGKIS